MLDNRLSVSYLHIVTALYTNVYAHTTICDISCPGKICAIREHSYAGDGRAIDWMRQRYIMQVCVMRVYCISSTRTEKQRLFRLLIIGGHFTCTSTAS